MSEQSYHFDNTCVIITGASAGIGRSIAQQFGKAGAYVINADISPDPKADVETLPTHEKIISEGGKSEYVETDISNPDDIDRAIERARDAGGVDVLMNNASIFAGENFNTVTEQEFDNMYDVNVKGPFLFTRGLQERKQIVSKIRILRLNLRIRRLSLKPPNEGSRDAINYTPSSDSHTQYI